MSKDVPDRIAASCSTKVNNVPEGVIDVTNQRPELRALSLDAVEAGCRDLIDTEGSRRFMLSPFDFSGIFTRPKPNPLVEFPSFVGKVEADDAVCYVFEIPLSAVALELYPDFERVEKSARGTGSPFESFSSVLEETRQKNPDLVADIFENPSKYWAIDTEGRFILIFPITTSG